MKILYLSAGLSSLGNHDYKFLNALVNHGYETYLVSYHPEKVADNIIKLDKLKTIHRKPRFFIKFQRYFYFTRVFNFRKLLKEIKPDIVHSGNTWNYSFLAALSGFHPLLVMPFGSDILIDPYRYPLCRIINKFTISKADIITCDCNVIKNKLISEYRYPEKKIVVFPRGIELDLFNPNRDKGKIREKFGWIDKNILIMNRHFESVYGVTYFIETIPQIIKLNSNIRIILVGEGSLMNKILNMISKNNLENYIRVIGRVERENMAMYLNASDVYVSTSLSDGTSLSLLEAMACGLPVVVSDIPAILEWIKDGYNGFVFPRKNNKILASKILYLVGNPSLQKLMGKRNFEIAKEKTDWRKNFDKLQEIYRRLVKRNFYEKI